MYVRAHRWARFLCSVRIFIDKKLVDTGPRCC
ncbi:hypothetical protein [Salmonella phage SD-12_S18]|nr:hypothetical protein [Salmonella phage SD-12_S18]